MSVKENFEEMKRKIKEAWEKNNSYYTPSPNLNPSDPDAELRDLLFHSAELSPEQMKKLQKALFQDPTTPLPVTKLKHNPAAPFRGIDLGNYSPSVYAWNGKITDVKVYGSENLISMGLDASEPEDETETKQRQIKFHWDQKSYLEPDADLVILTLPAGINIQENSDDLMLLKVRDDYLIQTIIPGSGSEIFTVDRIVHLLPELSPEDQEKWIQVIDQQAQEMEARAAALRIASMAMKTRTGKLPPNSP